ncbi:MAG: winged helix DNA-binding domain-containing protein [Bifidobacteriaceae bacterium]|nr:winged helix DNA-binding domain-containing protein [Bifidobacteriaceae bacterium]
MPVTRAQLAALRLRGLALARRAAGGRIGDGEATARSGILDVGERLFAAQGQDLPGVLWSFGLRVRGATRADVRAVFDSGDLVRSWPMRGTLHVVMARDLAWILSLTGARTVAAASTRRAGLGLDGPALAAARSVVEAELGGGRSASRKSVLAAIRRAGIDTGDGRGYHLLFHLALDGVICFGPFMGTEQRLVLLEEWVPAPRVLDRDEAMAELVRRYLAGHGPASVADIGGYCKLPLGWIRAALADLGGEVAAVDHAGTTLWAPSAALAGEPEGRPGGEFLLPGFDEFLLGYSDRSAVLDAEHAEAIVPGGNGVFRPTLVSRGRVVGTWRPSLAAAGITVTLAPFAPLSQRARAGFAREARAYAAFCGEPLAGVRVGGEACAGR